MPFGNPTLVAEGCRLGGRFSGNRSGPSHAQAFGSCWARRIPQWSAAGVRLAPGPGCLYKV